MSTSEYNESAYLKSLLSALQSFRPADVKISVISDPHYFASSLGTSGAAFDAYLASDRKMIAESDAILQSAIDIIKADKPDILLITGDLTKDGEKVSHEAFAAYLSTLETTGVKVYVIPGNHDVNNPHAVSYSGSTTTPTAQVSAEMFADIYNNFGYGEALYTDSASLSYIAAPQEKLWILAIDSCSYDSNTTDSVTYGALKAETKAWVLDKLAEARMNGITVLGMMHHNLSEHFTLQADLFPEYVVQDSQTFAGDLAAAGLDVMFTGHFHANDVNTITGTTSGGQSYAMTEIETGSLVTWPSPVRTVTLSSDGTMDIGSTSVASIDYNTGGLSFREYAINYLTTGLQQIAVNYLKASFGVSTEQAQQVAPLFASAMAAHYTGDEHPDATTQSTIQAMAASNNPMQTKLAAVLQSIWTDGSPSDTTVSGVQVQDFWAGKSVADLKLILAETLGLTAEQHYELYGNMFGLNEDVPLLNASVDGLGDVVTLYFGQTLDAVHLPSVNQFLVDNGGVSQSISSLQVVNNQVILKLSAPLDLAAAVHVSYTDVTYGDDVNTVQYRNGNDVPAFQNIEVQNMLALRVSGTESFSFTSTMALSSGAEISAFDAVSGRLFVTSSSGLQVLSVDDQLKMTLLGTVSFALLGGSNDVNSVDVKDGIVAVAVAAADKTKPGSVYFLDADGNVDASMILGSVSVGALPDMLTFSADGKTVLVANEGERNTPADVTAGKSGIDPEGSVSIIDLSNGIVSATVKTASFAAFNDKLEALQAEGVRLFAGEKGFETITVSQDLEPEYISISPDGKSAFVTLQENNAIGILDIATGTFTDIVPLGLKSFFGLPFDGSDKDGVISLQADQPVFGIRMPDGINSFTGSDGKTYYIIANEGDDRNDFLSVAEAVRLADKNKDGTWVMPLDTTVFPNETTLKTNAELARLTVSNAPGNNGDIDGDGKIEQILTYGARSFSIINENGVVVFDSGSQIEQFVASTGSFDPLNPTTSGLFVDSRSDNKGPEQEGVTIGHVGGKTLAFVGLERAGGAVLVYDVTDPQKVIFVQYLQHPVESATLTEGAGPEGLAFISADASPSGQALLVASNEYSKTVTIYSITNINDAPTVVAPVADVTTKEDGSLSVMVPVSTFKDVDAGDRLTYSATLADGSALPGWLHFDGELQGTLKYSTPETNAYFLQNGAWPATDSASAATAMSTGVKTDGGNLAWQSGDPANGQITTIAETLKADLGFAIGVVSTVPFSHATPAAFVSHNVNRSNYQDIAHEILFSTQPDVVIGGGLDSLFAKAVTNSAKASTDLDNNGFNDDYDAFKAGTAGVNHDNNGYTFVERATGVDGGTSLASAASGVDLNAGEKLFGLFGTSGGNFEYYNVADSPGTVSITRSTTDSTPTVDEDPTLAEMTKTTLSVLNQDKDGFFVMFEQGDIDWSNHANDYENMIGGVYDLEQAVTMAETLVDAGTGGMDWTNTLMIVTSDHSNSYMRLQEELGTGNLPAQTTVSGKYVYTDGSVTYGTTTHTNELVTLQARGAGAQLFKDYAGEFYAGSNIVDNTRIYQVMMSAAKDLGVDHIILFIGDGMNIEHEIAGSQYLYGKDFGLTWSDWGQLQDGWAGYESTWDVTSYNTYAKAAGVADYSAAAYDPLIGYDPAKGGQTPLPIGVTLSGTPDNSAVGTLEVKVTATDTSGATASDTFTITMAVKDTTAPEVISFSPLNASSGVVVDSQIKLTFSEAIQHGTGTIAIHSGSATGDVVESYDAANSTRLNISGNTLTIDPTSDLSRGTDYIVTFSEGSITDAAGNSYAGSADYGFTTAYTQKPADASEKMISGIGSQTDATSGMAYTLPVQGGVSVVSDDLTATGKSWDTQLKEFAANLGSGTDVSKTFQKAITDYVDVAGSTSAMTVRNISFTTDANYTGTDSVSITGTPAVKEALVIDARNLSDDNSNPAHLVLDNVEFAVVVGPAYIRGGEGSNIVYADDSKQDIVLGAANDTIHGGGGNDYIGSLEGDDVLYGDTGDDTLSGGTGNDTIDGGTDKDTVVYTGKFADYTISYNASTSAYTVFDRVAGRDGSDLLTNVEFLKFNDIVKSAADSVTVAAVDTAYAGHSSGLTTTETFLAGGGVIGLLAWLVF